VWRSNSALKLVCDFMTLRVRFWGTRGSIPAPGAETVRYGGNTPCVEVRTETGWLIILDAGTGMRALGQSLVERAAGNGISGDIFLTHAHWDHIQGIPFFAPIFQEGNHFNIWGSRALQTSIDRVIRDQMSPVFFPVPFDGLSARIDFFEIAEERRTGDGYEVTAFAVQHPGGALGYRFSTADSPGSSFVYISDNELGSSDLYPVNDGWRGRLAEFVRGTRVLVHDATYTADEYAQRRGWGHSTYDDAVALALDAEVEELVLFHHKPERSDAEVDRCVAHCRELVAGQGGSLRVIAAAEGMTLTV
jgi:phosphoribosyl 1,2-cyclic phosphodiesterase